MNIHRFSLATAYAGVYVCVTGDTQWDWHLVCVTSDIETIEGVDYEEFENELVLDIDSTGTIFCEVGYLGQGD